MWKIKNIMGWKEQLIKKKKNYICKNKKTKFLADVRHRMCRAGFGTDHRSLG